MAKSYKILSVTTGTYLHKAYSRIIPIEGKYWNNRDSIVYKVFICKSKSEACQYIEEACRIAPQLVPSEFEIIEYED